MPNNFPKWLNKCILFTSNVWVLSYSSSSQSVLSAFLIFAILVVCCGISLWFWLALLWWTLFKVCIFYWCLLFPHIYECLSGFLNFLFSSQGLFVHPCAKSIFLFWLIIILDICYFRSSNVVNILKHCEDYSWALLCL